MHIILNPILKQFLNYSKKLPFKTTRKHLKNFWRNFIVIHYIILINILNILKFKYFLESENFEYITNFDKSAKIISNFEQNYLLLFINMIN